MKPITTDHPVARRIVVRLGWFVGIWAASVSVLSGVAFLLHKIIIG